MLSQFSLLAFKSVVPGPAESSGNLLEMQIPGPNPKPSESETQVVGTNNQAFHVTFMHATV